MANCPSCNAEVAAGARWCGLCHSNVLDPGVGRLASPGKRLGAYSIDLLLPLVAVFLIFVVAGLGASTGTDAGSGVGALLGFALLIAYIIWALALFARGSTPGKKVLGMRVIKENGRSAGFLTMLLREWIGKPISGMVLLLGYVWILIDQDNQGWHDKLMSTYVVH